MRLPSLVLTLLVAACTSAAPPPVFDGGPCGGSCGAGTICVDNVCVVSPDAAVIDVQTIDTGARPDAGPDTGPDTGPADIGFDVIPDGCLATIPGNCCGAACPAVVGAQPICGGGVCGFACTANLGDCDGDPTNGCETPTNTTDAHCGACGRACTMGQHCAGGTCACTMGQMLCSMNCVDPMTDAAHCGGCGAPCAAGRACIAGQCVTCPTGQTLCGTTCVATDTSVANCGGCGRACPTPPVGTMARCVAGVCGLTAPACPAGTGNCDGQDANGCETSTTANVMNCGVGGADSTGCGRACSSAGGMATCAAGVCGIVCGAGRDNCDGNLTNGCETDLTTSDGHCGACAHPCAAGLHCSGSTCTL